MTTHFRGTPIADERNGTPPFKDCGPAGAVNLARAADDGETPGTDAEVIAIRRLIGATPGGRTTLPMVAHAMLSRYGYATQLGDGTWTPIYEGLTTDRWLIVRGDYKALPLRMLNPGQPNVEHFIVVGPGPVIVDPIRKPVPVYYPATMAEIRHFCSTGEWDSLSIREYSHVKPPTSAPDRPKGAIGYLDAMGVELFNVVKGIASPVLTNGKPTRGNVHGYVGPAPAKPYKPNLTANRILSGARKGQYVRAAEGTLSQETI